MATEFALPSPPQSAAQLYNKNENFDYNEKSQPPAFLRLLRLSFTIQRVSGYFPLHPKTIQIKNLFSFIIIAFVSCMNLYMLTLKTVPALAEMFSNWTREVTVTFGICLYFGLTVSSLYFIVGVGYNQKLEHLSELISHATNQKGLEIRFNPISKKLRIIQITVVIVVVIDFLMYLCVWTIDSASELSAKAVRAYRDIMGESWPAHVLTLIWIPLGYLVLYQSALLYWICCKCLRVEFEQVNRDIAECNIKNVSLFKAIQMRHCRLLKCLDYLHEMVAFYVMSIFALGSLISTLFAYVMLLSGTDAGFRILSLYWLCLTACLNCILCLSAQGLHKAVKASSERACSKLAESSKDIDIDSKTYSIANMIWQQATIDSGITAFGFFTVSKELLLTIYSFIATYVVILLQSPPASTDTGKANYTSSSG